MAYQHCLILPEIFFERNFSLRVQSFMKCFFSLLTLILLLILASSPTSSHAQATPEKRTEKNRTLFNAMEVSVSTTASQSPALQAQNWKEEKEQNPDNSIAWLNYYLWTERDKQLSQTEKKQLLQQTVTDAENHIANSSPFFLMR